MPLDRIIPYGDPIRAEDIERYGGREAALWLTDLGRLLIQAEMAAERLTYLVPAVTDRIGTRDGGVDASLDITVELPAGRTPGLINNGRTVYQFKWRARREDRLSAATGELKKLREKSGLPDTYVYITNRHPIVGRLPDGLPPLVRRADPCINGDAQRRRAPSVEAPPTPPRTQAPSTLRRLLQAACDGE